MCSSPRGTVQSPAPVRRPRGPLPPRLPGATVVTAVEGPGTTATDQVMQRTPTDTPSEPNTYQNALAQSYEQTHTGTHTHTHAHA